MGHLVGKGWEAARVGVECSLCSEQQGLTIRCHVPARHMVPTGRNLRPIILSLIATFVVGDKGRNLIVVRGTRFVWFIWIVTIDITSHTASHIASRATSRVPPIIVPVISMTFPIIIIIPRSLKSYRVRWGVAHGIKQRGETIAPQVACRFVDGREVTVVRLSLRAA